MSCEPVRVTAYVDGALDDAARAEMQNHLAECETCRGQAERETELRRLLLEAPRPEPPPGLEPRLRTRLRRSRRRPLRWLLPIAACLAVLVWGRSTARFVAWELSRDHDHCYSMEVLPAKVWTNDPHELAIWFEREGTELPFLPAAVGELELVGARYCFLLPGGTRAPHLYYVSEDRRASLFLVPRRVRFRDRYVALVRGRPVALLRLGGSVVGIVTEHPQDLQAFQRAFTTTVASMDRDPGSLR